MMGEIVEAVRAFEDDRGVRVMLIEGAGRGFSAAGDFDFLDELKAKTPFEIRDEVYAFFAGGIKAIKLFSKPTVAAVNGPASGAGFEIALACDFRIASSDAVFIESWINLGLISPLGGMFLLPRLVGLAKANEILMLGKPVRGEEAAEIGLMAMKEGIRRGMES